MVSDERADLAAYLATFSREQWDAPTLCARWRVRDVVAHIVSYDELGWFGLLGPVVQGRFLSPRVNAITLSRYNMRSPEELLALLGDRRRLRGVPSALGGRVGLVEAVIHHQDIRRSLGPPRTVPAERLLKALRLTVIAPDVGGPWRIRGLRLVATDLDWAIGIGPEVRGPAEVLLMTIAGRRGVAGSLSGPGQPKLARRVERR